MIAPFRFSAKKSQREAIMEGCDVDKASIDRKQGVDILSTSGLHKNTVCYLTNDLLFYTNKQKRNLQLQKRTQDKCIVIESTIRILPLCIIIYLIKCKIPLHYRNPRDSNNYTYDTNSLLSLLMQGPLGCLHQMEKKSWFAKIMSSSLPALAETILKIPLIKSCVKAIILQDIDSQCQKLCQKKENPSLLRMTKDSQKELNKIISMDLYSD